MTVHEWREAIFPEFEVRKTRKQKTAFIHYLTAHFGDRMSVEEGRSFPKSRNLVIGNPDTARVIFTAHYDTCAKLPFPNFITPKNIPIFILYQIILALAIILPCFAIAGAAAVLTKPLPDMVSFLTTELALFASFIAIMWLMLAGPANPHTANDNTSGVVTVLALADMGIDAAFVLFDHEESGLLGSSEFAKRHRDVRNNTAIINFDCVSDGKFLMLISSKPMRQMEWYGAFCAHACEVIRRNGKDPVIAASRNTLYPSDQMNFKKYIAVAAMNKSKVGLYMDKIHTPKDTVFEESNLDTLVEVFGDIQKFNR